MVLQILFKQDTWYHLPDFWTSSNFIDNLAVLDKYNQRQKYLTLSERLEAGLQYYNNSILLIVVTSFLLV